VATLPLGTNAKSPQNLWKSIALSVMAIAVLLIVLYIATGIISDRTWGGRPQEQQKVLVLQTEVKEVSVELQKLKEQIV
jgi:hypothetical protein